MRFFGGRGSEVGGGVPGEEVQPERKMNYEATITVDSSVQITGNLVMVTAWFQNLFNKVSKQSETDKVYKDYILCTQTELDEFMKKGRSGKIMVDEVPLPNIKELLTALDEKGSKGGKISVTNGAIENIETLPENDVENLEAN